MSDTRDLWLKFRLGDALPASSQLAQWVATLAVIYNDMAVTTNRLYQLMEPQRSVDAHERMYLSRLQLSHFREAVKFICGSDSRCQEVAAFLERLPTRAKENLHVLVEAADPWETSFVNVKLKPIRDQVFHYPGLAGGAVQRALMNLADEETGIEKIEGALQYRLRFADDTAANVTAEHIGDELGRLFSDFMDLFRCLLRFSEEALMVYLEEQAQGEAPGDSQP